MNSSLPDHPTGSTDSTGTHSTGSPTPQIKMSTKVFVLAALAVALIFAGGISYYASSHPDGLTRVAADKGFDSQQKSSATADSPLAGYAVKDIANERLSGGLAGATGVVIVLALMGGLAFVVRRRTAHGDSTTHENELASGQQG